MAIFADGIIAEHGGKEWTPKALERIIGRNRPLLALGYGVLAEHGMDSHPRKEKPAMKTIVSLFAVYVLVLATGTAWADEWSFGTLTCSVRVVATRSTEEEACATKGDFVTVDGDVSVVPLWGSVDSGTINATEPVTGIFYFWVDAACQDVFFCASASSLYKNGNPSSAFSIPPLQDVGIVVDLFEGGPLGGEDDTLDYAGPCVIDEFPGTITSPKEFESSQSDSLHQNVTMTVTWRGYDAELFQGIYEGKVRLYCMCSETAACCFPDGNCLIASQQACLQQSGTYAGAETSCDPNPCPPSAVSTVMSSGKDGFIVTIPSPFSTSAAIWYGVTRSGNVGVEIVDTSGRVIRRFVDPDRSGGAYSFVWDGRNGGGGDLPTGVYFVRVTTARGTTTGRAILVK